MQERTEQGFECLGITEIGECETVIVKQFIDFQKMFEGILKEEIDNIRNLSEMGDEYKYMRDINKFAENQWLDIDADECEIGDVFVSFAFSKCFGGANESDNSNSYARVDIVYSRQDDAFVSFSYEQG